MNSVFSNSPDFKTMNDNYVSKKSIDTMWSELVQGQDSPHENNSPKAKYVDYGVDYLPVSQILSKTYSYSSDSSPSPQASVSKGANFQFNSGSPVFIYDEGSGSTSSHNSNNTSWRRYTDRTSESIRSSSVSDPGSPTMDDVILMGSSRDSFSSSVPKMQDITIADLVSSLSLGGNTGQGPISLGSRSLAGVLPKLNDSNPFANPVSQRSQYTNIAAANQSNSPNYVTNMPSNSLPTPGSLSHLQASGNVDSNLMQLSQLQNMWYNSHLLDSAVVNMDRSNLSNLLANSTDPYSIEKAAKLHRNAASVCDATCTWSGQLPIRIYKNPVYSCKLFLGGVPWDVTEVALKQTFIHFGNIKVEWPGKDSSCSPPRGYVYILFENEKQVKALLSACSQDFDGNGSYYYKISSKRMRLKEVQVIPWVISDSNYVRCPSHQLDPAKTVFVGALHGMLTAEGLANIMNDLFGGVVFSGIDTEKHKYPIGSGRVTFNNVQSYRKAVRAAFIEIKTTKFTKKVQVDPYLADSLCQLCGAQQGPFFCRDEICFKYFCRTCWELTHSTEAPVGHKVLMRNSKGRITMSSHFD